MTKPDKLVAIKTVAEMAISADREWQLGSTEDFSFRDGEQWPGKEKQILADEHRPVLTFNLTKSSIDLVMGLNADQRVRFRCTPVEPQDDFLCEVLNHIVYWLAENRDWDSEEDDSFESAAICGRGWMGIDFLPDPKRYGEIIIDMKSIAKGEVTRDPASRRRDLKDAGFILQEKWLSVEDFRISYPKSKIDLNEAFDLGYIPANPIGASVQSAFDSDPDLENEKSDYDRALDTAYYDRSRRMIRVLHMEYWTTFKRYFVRHPRTGVVDEVDTTQISWSDFKEWFAVTYPDVEFTYEVQHDKKVKWIQFCGDEILYDDDSPLPYDGFSIVPCFAYNDVSKRTADSFGIVRLMKDAQREVNKRWSQTLNLINNQVQPGLYAETGAFEDREQAELSMKEPGSITYLQDGVLVKKRLQERTVPTFPQATMQLEEHAQLMLRRITGINPDLLGQDRGRQEPGVVVKLRQQQGLIILKPLFQAYKKMKKELFERQIAIIMKYMPTQQMRKILGNSPKYQFKEQDGMLLVGNPETGMVADLRDVKNVEYNIDAEEVSQSMTKRAFELATMIEMQRNGLPVEPTVMIDKMDIDATEKETWKKFITQQQESQAQAAKDTFELEKEKVRLQHEREVMKIKLDAGVKTDKIETQVAKDIAKDKVDRAKVNIEALDTVLDYDAKIKNIMQKQEELEANTIVNITNLAIQAKKVQQEGKKDGQRIKSGSDSKK